MKRITGLLFACLALTGSAWVAHVVWGQTAETKEEKKFTISQTQLDKYVAEQIAKAVAAEREKAGHEKSTADKPVTDDQVLRAENWHRAVFNKAEFVVYTGPGQFMFHHWVETGAKAPASKPPAAKSGSSAAPASKGG